jgi:ferredoxin
VCQFCVEHGEGERWYLSAKNYAHDLRSDLERRDYIVRFIRDFGRTRARTIAGLDLVEHMPAAARRSVHEQVKRRMQPHHFGQPVPIEECERIFDIATSVTVIPCICRMHTPGKKAEEVCLLVTTQAVEPVLQEGFRDYEDGPDLKDFHTVEKAEAMQLLRDCEERGLMHSIWTFETPFCAAICNCNLESGCMAMRLTAGYGAKLMWRGDWVSRLDSGHCTGCGTCAELCPFGAIDMNGTARVRVGDCWGCGVCRAGCAERAITLVDRRSVPEVASLW